MRSAATPTRCSPAGTWCANRFSFRFSLYSLRGQSALRRKAHREAAACTRLAVDVEARLVARDSVLDDGQAQSRAAGFARAAAVDAVEALGQPRQMLRRDAGAGVLDGERRAAVVFPPMDGHFAAWRRVPDRVADEVAERAGELAFRAQQIHTRAAFQGNGVQSAGKRCRVRA